MSGLKQGEPFGLAEQTVDGIDWGRSLSRVIDDLKSDFIYAPHLRYIYGRAGKELIDLLKAELKSGTYQPSMPLTIEVPKSHRIRVAVNSKRLGPNYSRPGSILLPRDRLLYQALADEAVMIIDKKTDKERSFSHRLSGSASAPMFKSTRLCWNALQTALRKKAKKKGVNYILKVDIANYFGSINIHRLANILSDAGYPKPLVERLEFLLTAYTGDRSSRSILQGMHPSDLLGNFYLSPVDRLLADIGVDSARYVDDIYIFIESVEHADRVMKQLIPELRHYDLVLNEAKSVIMPKASLVTEEPDLEELFANALSEITEYVDEEDLDTDYGFQSEWQESDDDEEDEEDTDEDVNVELEATKLLFDSISEYPGNEESIERFCLPLFSKFESDYAVSHVYEAFKRRPAMSQIFAAYLAKFLDRLEVVEFLSGVVSDLSNADWQRLWALAALHQADTAEESVIKVVVVVLKDAACHDVLRASCAMFIGRFGDYTRRQTLCSTYQSVSPFVQSAIYYISGQWPAIERTTAKSTWAGHGVLHNLISIGRSKHIILKK